MNMKAGLTIVYMNLKKLAKILDMRKKRNSILELINIFFEKRQ